MLQPVARFQPEYFQVQSRAHCKQPLSVVYSIIARLAPDACSACALSPQSCLVTVGSGDRINLWDLRTPNPVRYIQRTQAQINTIAMSPDGKHFVTGGADAIVRLWDYSTLKPMGQETGHSAAINRIRWSDDGKKICSVAEDGTMCLWAPPV